MKDEKDFIHVSGERLAAMRRHIEEAAEEAGIGREFKEFAEASDHNFYCRCDICKKWWQVMGPDDDNSYGPFTVEEMRGNV